MFEHAKKPQDHQDHSRSSDLETMQQQESVAQISDLRPEAESQRALVDLANQSSSVSALDLLENLANSDLDYGLGKESALPTDSVLSPPTQANDDAQLEQKAGRLEEAVLNVQTNSAKTALQGPNSNDLITQSQKKDDKSIGSDPIESIEKLGSKNITKESEVNPADKGYQEQLHGLKSEGLEMGEKAQIAFQGELTRMARFNRFIGKESTYSILLKKAEAFNKSKDVIEKQTLLKELKPLARTWLERHKEPAVSGAKEDENEALKRASIQRFLDQTNSNFPEIIAQYQNLQKRLETFKVDPIKNRGLFYEAVDHYKQLNGAVETYKSTYPPSVNLLFISELEGIEAADQALIKTASQKGAEFNSGLGFSISNTEINFDLISGKYMLSGDLALALGGVISSSGKADIEFNKDDTVHQVTLKGASCKFVLDGINFELAKLDYDYNKKEFLVQEATGSLDILGTKASLKALGVSIKNGEADFLSLEGKLLGKIDSTLGIAVVDPDVKYVKGQSIEVNGKLSLQIENIVNATGKVGILLNQSQQIQDIRIENASGMAQVGAFQLQLNGLSYAYSAQKFSVAEARGELTIFDRPIALAATGVSLEGKKFDYETIQGALPKVDYGFFSLDETEISYSKSSRAFEGHTAYQFRSSALPIGFKDFKTSGEVDIHWNPEGEKYYAINQGELKFKLFEQEVEVTSFNYNSAANRLQAHELNLNVHINDFQKSFKGKNIDWNEQGFAFEELKTEASGQEFNVKVFSLIPKSYSITQAKEEGGLKVNAQGAMRLNLPDYLGIKGSGEIEGEVGIGLNKADPDYRITAGKANVSMPNPLQKISELFGDNWSGSRYELSASIPVFPAVSAVFGLFLEFGAQFDNEIAAIIELDKEKNAIHLKASTGVSGNIAGGVFGGVQGGHQLLIALALLLKAALSLGIRGDITYEKDFLLGEQPVGSKIKEDAGLTYETKGDAKMEGSLVLVASALLFFRKELNFVFAEKSLGSFEFSNKKVAHPDVGETALVDRENLVGMMEEEHKDKAKSLSLEELLDLDYNHRFSADEKKDTLDVIKTAEAGRELSVTTEETTLGAPAKFNNAPLANLQFYNTFMDKRCGWDGINEVLASLGNSLKSKAELSASPDKGKTYLQDTVLTNIKKLGENTNIAQAFVTHYNEKVRIFSNSYAKDIIAEYQTLLLKKAEMLQIIENMKKNHLHSSFWGDASKQAGNIRTSSWFGASNYEKFASDYIEFRRVVLDSKSLVEEINKVGKETAFRLIQNHQRQIEKGTK